MIWVRYVKFKYLLSILVILIFIGLVSADYCGPSCTTDDDCDEGYSCEPGWEGNQCIKICTSASDCDTHEECYEGFCMFPFDESPESLDNLYCNCDADCYIYDYNYINSGADLGIKCNSGECDVKEGMCLELTNSGLYFGCEDWQHCNRDNHCETNSGRCASNDDCEVTEDCNEDHYCERKPHACLSDGYCPYFAYCNEEHTCSIRELYIGAFCINDSDCEDWQFCDESGESYVVNGEYYYCQPLPGHCKYDSDCDMGYICNEHNCIPSPLETSCENHYDDDNDGLIDCTDPDCDGINHCEYGTESTCSDDRDNDGDGLTDCEDTDCENKYCNYDPYMKCIDHECVETDTAPYEICNNGIDDDGNGYIDCEDEYCHWRDGCQQHEYTCNDRFDNDGDGKIDCEDPDCQYYKCLDDDIHKCYNFECINVEHGFPCEDDSDCSENYYCNEYGGCSRLECEDDEYPHNHKCVPRCENNDDCNDDEYCLSGTYCAKLHCSGDYKIENHSCVYYNPIEEEKNNTEKYCENDMDCNVHEACINNECTLLIDKNNCILDCVKISKSGNYKFCNDIHVTNYNISQCILINSDNVTLDGQGHKLYIFRNQYKNVPKGIVVTNSKDVHIKDLYISGFNLGIEGYNVENIKIINNNIANGTSGIKIVQSIGNNIYENKISYNSGNAIYISGVLSGNISKNNVSYNSKNGIYIKDSSDFDIFDNNIIFNKEGAVLIFSSDNLNLRNNLIIWNGNGVQVSGPSSENNHIFSNIICNNEKKDGGIIIGRDVFDSGRYTQFKNNTCNTFYSNNINNHSYFCPNYCNECYLDEECSDVQSCYNGECINLTGQCGYAQNHTWVNYECCEDGDCKNNLTCINHTCTLLAKPGEQDINKTPKKPKGSGKEKEQSITIHPSNQSVHGQENQNKTDEDDENKSNQGESCMLPVGIILFLFGYYAKVKI